jgi:predicted HicB family RNase H-like nuclease
MRKELTIEEMAAAVNRINHGETRKTVGESFGMSENTLSRRLKDGGYAYDNSTKKYLSASPNPENQEENKPEIKENKKKENKPSIKQEKKEIRILEIQEERKVKKKVTYEIDEDLHFELRMQAFRAKRNVSELVEAAIKQYLSDEK